MARGPFHFVPEVCDALVEAIEAGATISEACAMYSVTYRGFKYARQRDEKFDRKVKRAKKAGIAKLILIVRRAAEKEPQLALNMLKCLKPEQWSERRKLEHSGPGGGPLKLQIIEELVDADRHS